MFNYNFSAPVIINRFIVKHAEVLCAHIGECGKFSASDCMGDCACRLNKLANVFQTGPTQTAINRFLEKVTALQILRNHKYPQVMSIFVQKRD